MVEDLSARYSYPKPLTTQESFVELSHRHPLELSLVTAYYLNKQQTFNTPYVRCKRGVSLNPSERVPDIDRAIDIISIRVIPTLIGLTRDVITP